MTTPTAFALLANGVADVLRTAHPGVPVYVNRTRMISAAEAQAILVRLGSSRRESTGPLGCTDWQTEIEVECLARTPTLQDPMASADPLLASAWAALLGVPLGLPDVTDVDADPEITPVFDAGETPMVSLNFRLLVRHRTHANSLTPWSQ
jgi:hypothetical protein